MCSFCEELDLYMRNDYRGDVDGRYRIYHKYKAALINETYRKFPDGASNRAGVSTGNYHKLNFCPECGRKIKEEA